MPAWATVRGNLPNLSNIDRFPQCLSEVKQLFEEENLENKTFEDLAEIFYNTITKNQEDKFNLAYDFVDLEERTQLQDKSDNKDYEISWKKNPGGEDLIKSDDSKFEKGLFVKIFWSGWEEKSQRVAALLAEKLSKIESATEIIARNLELTNFPDKWVKLCGTWNIEQELFKHVIQDRVQAIKNIDEPMNQFILNRLFNFRTLKEENEIAREFEEAKKEVEMRGSIAYNNSDHIGGSLLSFFFKKHRTPIDTKIHPEPQQLQLEQLEQLEQSKPKLKQQEKENIKITEKISVFLRKAIWDHISKAFAEYVDIDKKNVYSIIVLPKNFCDSKKKWEEFQNKTLYKIELPEMVCSKIAILLFEVDEVNITFTDLIASGDSSIYEELEDGVTITFESFDEKTVKKKLKAYYDKSKKKQGEKQEEKKEEEEEEEGEEGEPIRLSRDSTVKPRRDSVVDRFLRLHKNKVLPYNKAQGKFKKKRKIRTIKNKPTLISLTKKRQCPKRKEKIITKKRQCPKRTVRIITRKRRCPKRKIKYITRKRQCPKNKKNI